MSSHINWIRPHLKTTQNEFDTNSANFIRFKDKFAEEIQDAVDEAHMCPSESEAIEALWTFDTLAKILFNCGDVIYDVVKWGVDDTVVREKLMPYYIAYFEAHHPELVDWL